MAHSEISICNISLAMLGADSIRSFDENNKRARLSENLYKASRDFLLARYDWSFSRGFLELQEVVDDSISIPEGLYAYKIPSDSNVPRDMYPREMHFKWEVVGPYIMTPANPAYLYYSKYIANVGQFNEHFVEALTYMLAAKMAPSISQDSKVTQNMMQGSLTAIAESMAADAAIGSEYRQRDETPDFDTFVQPDIRTFMAVGATTWPPTE